MTVFKWLMDTLGVQKVYKTLSFHHECHELIKNRNRCAAQQPVITIKQYRMRFNAAASNCPGEHRI